MMEVYSGAQVELYTRTVETRLNTDGRTKSTQGPCGAHFHETNYYRGEVKDAHVGSLRMPQTPWRGSFALGGRCI
jgi:hypothetical protein